jgi:hypothetical protein
VCLRLEKRNTPEKRAIDSRALRNGDGGEPRDDGRLEIAVFSEAASEHRSHGCMIGNREHMSCIGNRDRDLRSLAQLRCCLVLLLTSSIQVPRTRPTRGVSEKYQPEPEGFPRGGGEHMWSEFCDLSC